MRTISDTIERLAKYRTQPVGASVTTRLKQLEVSDRNPGQLTGWYSSPAGSEGASGLVVVLHGCTQTAAAYDHGSGWSKLADDYGFAVLFPEQSRQNNANLCFNWFQAEDISRDAGEVLSIREMVASMIADHGIDPRRVYVTGLSAGGAMANALLATYPDVFAGGAMIAGLPYGVAASVPEAFDRMRGHGLPSASALERRLRMASSHQGPWPTISVWHGTADNTVVEANATAIIDQWRGVHGVELKEAQTEKVDGQTRAIWTDATGREVIEHFRVNGMGHGTPLEKASGYGRPTPYMLDVGISSTMHIARNWGLIPSFERREDSRVSETVNTMPRREESTAAGGIREIIEGALRSAGLMK